MDRRTLPLLAFFGCVVLSLLLVAPSESPPRPAAVVKCLPIACLVWFLAVAEGWRGQARWFMMALILSMLGDVYLLWPQTYFLEGVAAFAVAQCLYVAGHGMKGATWQVGLGVHGLAALIMMYILPVLPTTADKVFVTLYSLTINTVLWRALDRAFFRSDLPVSRRLCAALGGVTFCVSDTSLVFLQVGQMVPHLTAQLVILSTYYLAQFFHALGAAEEFWAPERKVKKKRRN